MHRANRYGSDRRSTRRAEGSRRRAARMTVWISDAGGGPSRHPNPPLHPIYHCSQRIHVMQIPPPRERSLGKKQANLLTAIMRGVPVLGRGKEPHVLTDWDVRSALDTLPPGPDAQQT